MSSKPERVAENAFARKAKAKWGAEIIKQQMMAAYGVRGRADRLILLPFGALVILEFKRIGKGPSKLQEINHAKLRRLKHKVYVVYTWQEAMAICERAVRKARKRWHRLRAEKISRGVHSKRR